MLSRIAESLYWMSRYLERVDSTARLVDINLLHLIEAESALSEASEWRPLLAICGHEEAYARLYGTSEISSARAIHFMTVERRNPGSIRTSLRLARENARVVRDRISKEMWESVNELWLRSEARLERPLAADYYRLLRDEVGRFHGQTSSTMMRGEAFGFYLLGFFLERADMTARIVDVKYHLLLPGPELVGSALDYYQWAALLKSLSGFEAYRRKYNTGMRPTSVAEFVILSPDFPRALRFSIDRIAQALDGMAAEAPCPASAHAVAALQADVAHRSADTIFQHGLHEFLEDFVTHVGALDGTLHDEVFHGALRDAACAG